MKKLMIIIFSLFAMNTSFAIECDDRDMKEYKLCFDRIVQGRIKTINGMYHHVFRGFVLNEAQKEYMVNDQNLFIAKTKKCKNDDCLVDTLGDRIQELTVIQRNLEPKQFEYRFSK